MRFFTTFLILTITLSLQGQTAYWAATYKEHIKRGSTVLMAKGGYTFERTTYDLYIEKFYDGDDQPPNKVITYADRRRKVLEGPWETYYSSGKLEVKGRYQEGEKSNRWYFYRPSGDLWKICTYDDGIEECELLEKEVLTDAPPLEEYKTSTGNRVRVRPRSNSGGDEEIFKVVEERPRFSGCEDLPSLPEIKQCAQQELLKNIYSRIRLPTGYQGPEGTVVVTFVVEKDGSITGVRIIRSIEESLNEMILNVVRTMPAFIPGYQQGKPVRVQFNLPIKIQLS